MLHLGLRIVFVITTFDYIYISLARYNNLFLIKFKYQGSIPYILPIALARLNNIVHYNKDFVIIGVHLT